jgi:nucleoside-diphosphate-sugar epimerase
MENDFYGVKKCLGEDVLNNSGYKNYTIVRPVVVYGENRYPITTWANNVVAHRAQNNKPLLLPLGSKDKGASLIYAGDIAKLFCGLLFNEKAFGESYTFGSPENLTWEDTAKICEKVMNLKSIWIETEDFAKVISGNSETVPVAVRFMLYYDRLFNRSVCVDKAIKDAGLTKDDFLTFEQGLKKCYAVFPKNYQPQHYEQSFIDYMDEYLKIRGKK